MIDCGLCPRFYTEGDSRCPGCGGPNFSEKHPSCSILNCCYKMKELEVCSLCNEFSCEKYADIVKIEQDSFVTHKKMFPNLEFIKNNGINTFINEQKIMSKTGKYWYVAGEWFIITINANSYTIITAHKNKLRSVECLKKLL